MEQKQNIEHAFRVYGDNILECLEFIAWIKVKKYSRFIYLNKIGPLDRPIYLFRDEMSGSIYSFQLCPYYGGVGGESIWDNDPLQTLFSEKPDIVVTKVDSDKSESGPIVAFEICDAIQAGNQAWQRFRRAYSAGEALIPYFYVLPLIGWERDSGGLELKNARYQSAQISLAQLTLCSFFGAPNFQVYRDTSWLDYAEATNKTLPNDYKDIVGIGQAVGFLSEYLRMAAQNSNLFSQVSREYIYNLIKGMFTVANTYMNHKSTKFPLHMAHPAFISDEEISKAAQVYAESITKKKQVFGKYSLHNIDMNDFCKHGAFSIKIVHSTTSSSGFTNNVLNWFNWKSSFSRQEKIEFLKKWEINIKNDLTSIELDKIALKHRCKMPLSYKTGRTEAFVIQNRDKLCEILKVEYPEIPTEVVAWIKQTKKDHKPIIVIPLYGYKPSGDSRPDRGLIPSIAALFPFLAKDKNMIVLLYSKYTPENWKNILDSENNELWNVIKVFAGALVVDKTKEALLLTETHDKN